MRAKISDLSLALEGRFDDHHALTCQLHLEHVSHLNDMIATLDAQVEAMMVPFRPQRDLLATIPGIGPAAAAAIISEIGTSPAEFFTAGAHLASWAGLCPGNHESAGKRRHGKPRKGSRADTEPIREVLPTKLLLRGSTEDTREHYRPDQRDQDHPAQCRRGSLRDRQTWTAVWRRASWL